MTLLHFNELLSKRFFSTQIYSSDFSMYHHLNDKFNVKYCHFVSHFGKFQPLSHYLTTLGFTCSFTGDQQAEHWLC